MNIQFWWQKKGDHIWQILIKKQIVEISIEISQHTSCSSFWSSSDSDFSVLVFEFCIDDFSLFNNNNFCCNSDICCFNVWFSVCREADNYIDRDIDRYGRSGGI